MTIEFKKEQITSREEKTRKPYIGYFSPKGELIDYNVLLGGNWHDDWQNPVSKAFVSFVSYIIPGTSINELKKGMLFKEAITNNQYPGIDEYVIRGYKLNYDFNFEGMDYFLEVLYDRISKIENFWHASGSIEGYEAFEYQLLLFFKNAYKNKTFFDTIQRKITIENQDVVKERLKYEYRKCNFSDRVLDSIYRDHLRKELLSHFKDICVQYLGYDSLERFKPNGTEIKIPSWYEDYDFDFIANPRIITSSYPNVYERYYNYLLMDYSVHRLPRYYYNNQTGIYEKSDVNTFYESEKEQILEEEIKSIKKLVPLKERHKYFR